MCQAGSSTSCSSNQHPPNFNDLKQHGLTSHSRSTCLSGYESVFFHSVFIHELQLKSSHHWDRCTRKKRAERRERRNKERTKVIKTCIWGRHMPIRFILTYNSRGLIRLWSGREGHLCLEGNWDVRGTLKMTTAWLSCHWIFSVSSPYMPICSPCDRWYSKFVSLWVHLQVHELEWWLYFHHLLIMCLASI